MMRRSESEGKACVHRIMISCSLFENKSITRNPFGVYSKMARNNQNQKGISVGLSGASAQPLSVSCTNRQERYETMEVVHLFVLAPRQVLQHSSRRKLFTFCVIAVEKLPQSRKSRSAFPVNVLEVHRDKAVARV